MSRRAFSVTKEQLAAGRLGEAVGTAQVAQIHMLPRRLGGKDMDGPQAARLSAMVSLGKKVVLFRHGSFVAERQGVIEECAALFAPVDVPTGLVDHHARVNLPPHRCKVVVAAALHEIAFDKCDTCFDRGEVQDHSIQALIGRQPMRICETCKGTKRRRFNEDERVEELAREMTPAKAKAGTLDDNKKWLREMSAEARKMLSAVDYAKSVLLEAERVATAETARSLGRMVE